MTPCRPALFVLENVKNLKSHDQGKTFRIIMQTLDELGYDVADAADNGPDDPKIIDGQHFLPQHRERIVLVGFRRDLNLKTDFTLRNIIRCYPPRRPTLAELLEPVVDAKIYPDAGAGGNIYIAMRKSIRRGEMVLVMAWSTLTIQIVWRVRYLHATTKMAPKF
ncbi:DNA-cytosine methyltransferase [Salmonella bongori]|nr:DNA-cytosine methyltransferase [Salmonella bongori]